MQRPRIIYLAAVWWWVSFSLGAGHRRLPLSPASAPAAAAPAPDIAQVLYGAMFIVFVCELVALIQVRAWALWVMSAFLVTWSLIMLIKLPYAVSTGASLAPVLVPILVIINIAVITLIMRPRFRAQCAQFRKERDEELRMRDARKALGRLPR